MLLQYFYDKALAHASYLVGCQRSGTAIVIDPGRDIEPYLAAAKQQGVKVVAAPTHTFTPTMFRVLGNWPTASAQRCTFRTKVRPHGSTSMPPTTMPELVKDGDTFLIGNIKFTVLHTPGHTPESISFLVTDTGSGADKPMGIFTGDFVFVGSIGRPDLLEEAAGMVGTAEAGARELFHSAQRFKSLPDYLQVWPAHGAGKRMRQGARRDSVLHRRVREAVQPGTAVRRGGCICPIHSGGPTRSAEILRRDETGQQRRPESPR